MKSKLIVTIIITLVLCCSSMTSNANDDTPNERHSKQRESSKKEIVLQEVVVEGSKGIQAASEQSIRQKDFLNFPRKTASDLMLMVPGLYLTQHTGGAKAHQFFLRGFDCEHGKDLAAYIDGIPINEPAHVHGQGYLDLHFLIPETIRKMKIIEGSYMASYGDFANAGAVEFIPYTARPSPFMLNMSIGSFSTVESLIQASLIPKGSNTYAAVQLSRSNGFTNPGSFSAVRGFVSEQLKFTNMKLKLLYIGYIANSKAADTVPLSMVESKQISLYDGLDDSDGVNVRRHILGTWLKGKIARMKWKALIWAQEKRTDIWSNYTYYFYRPEAGDQQLQSDQRYTIGNKGIVRIPYKAASMGMISELGVSTRTDFVDQHIDDTQERKSFNTVASYEFALTGIGIYAEQQIMPFKHLRLVAGIRADTEIFRGDGFHDEKQLDIYTNRTKIVQDVPHDIDVTMFAISPKASVIYSPMEELKLFVNFGQGFDTPTAMEVAAGRRTLGKITSSELGVRSKLFHGILSLAASGFLMDKENERVFDAEAGIAVPVGATRRLGIETELRIQPLNWLYMAVNSSYVNAKFTSSDAEIPNEPKFILTSILAARHNCGVHGSIRVRYVGERKLDLGYSVEPFFLVDMLAAYETTHLLIELSVENLLNRTWYDTAFAYTSRPSPTDDPYTGIHVTAGTPRNIKFTLGIKY